MRLGPAIRGWLRRVLSLTDELTPWSVAEARRELDRIVETDRRFADAPTGVPLVLGRVADYYAVAADVAVPVHRPSVQADRKTGPARPGLELSAPTPEESPAAFEVAPIVPDESWPEPSVRPAVDDTCRVEPGTDRRDPPGARCWPSCRCNRPASSDQFRPSVDANELPALPVPQTSVQVEDRGRNRHVPEGVSSSRPLFGVHAARHVESDRGALRQPVPHVLRNRRGGPPRRGARRLRGPAAFDVGGSRRSTALPSPPTSGSDAASPTAAATPAAVSQADPQSAPSDSANRIGAAAGRRAGTSRAHGHHRGGVPVVLDRVGRRPRARNERRADPGFGGTPYPGNRARGPRIPGRAGGRRQAGPAASDRAVTAERVANLNATPWAEVWIDGRKIGETPLGRVPADDRAPRSSVSPSGAGRPDPHADRHDGLGRTPQRGR